MFEAYKEDWFLRLEDFYKWVNHVTEGNPSEIVKRYPNFEEAYKEFLKTYKK